MWCEGAGPAQVSFATRATLPWWLSRDKGLRLSCPQLENPYHLGSTSLCQQVGVSELDRPGQGCGTPNRRKDTSCPYHVSESFSFHHHHWLEQSREPGDAEVRHQPCRGNTGAHLVFLGCLVSHAGGTGEAQACPQPCTGTEDQEMPQLLPWQKNPQPKRGVRHGLLLQGAQHLRTVNPDSGKQGGSPGGFPKLCSTWSGTAVLRVEVSSCPSSGRSLEAAGATTDLGHGHDPALLQRTDPAYKNRLFKSQNAR